MNRKERRAATKRSQTVGGSPGSAQTAQLFADAVRHQQLGQGFDAEALCRAVGNLSLPNCDSWRQVTEFPLGGDLW